MVLDPRTFLGRCVAGEIAPDALDEEIDTAVAEWHESSSETALNRFLGMTEEEYGNWVIAPDTLPHIVAIRTLVEQARAGLQTMAIEAGAIDPS